MKTGLTMKVLKMEMLTVKLSFCVAAAGLVLAGVSAPVSAADTRPVMPLNGWSVKLGPGLGSAKTPFGVVEVASPAQTLDGAIYFHTSTGQPAQQVPIQRVGPGPWSSKSPFSSLYTNGTR